MAFIRVFISVHRFTITSDLCSVVINFRYFTLPPKTENKITNENLLIHVMQILILKTFGVHCFDGVNGLSAFKYSRRNV